MTVSDLWKEGQREWDPTIFEGVLNPEDQTLAKSLYLSQHSETDSYEWAYTKNARYNVRSGYWVATHVNLHDDETVTPPKGSVFLKTKIWNLNITPKIRHFLWKCLSGAIATTTQLITRTIPADPICQRCCKEDETINHILFTCPFAKAVWRHVHGTGQHYLSDYLEDNMRSLLLRTTISSLSQSQRLLPFWIVWRLWRSRNDFLFRKITRTPQSEATKGTNEATEWLDANINSEVDSNSTSPRTTPVINAPDGRLHQLVG
ncbi:Reverse transcriptase zinc-binding domain [Arabidopsis suecica]|uniref:Reverse transcriptase zinc-binding domain n=1 Tax=Arabidopsis suecica TaxID=45249 RepID=A0A8T2BK57_ARASU|nr:Reverse transcriptase zinc-binding domain [Arabidopsis suecica]